MGSLSLNSAMVQLLGRQPTADELIDEKLLDKAFELMQSSEAQMEVKTDRTHLKPVGEIKVTEIRETNEKPFVKEERPLPKA